MSKCFQLVQASLQAAHEWGSQGKKLKTALLKTQSERGRLNYTKHHDADWADSVDELVRIGAAMFRDLQKDTLKYQRCIRKASVGEKQRIDEVLSLLQLPAGEEQTIEGNPKEPLQAAELAKPKVQEEEGLVGLKVFKHVLSRTASDPSSPSFEKKQKAEEASSGSGLRRESSSLEVALESASAGGKERVTAVTFSKFGVDESQELRKWMQQEGESGMVSKVKSGKKKNMQKKTSCYWQQGYQSKGEEGWKQQASNGAAQEHFQGQSCLKCLPQSSQRSNESWML